MPETDGHRLYIIPQLCVIEDPVSLAGPFVFSWLQDLRDPFFSAKPNA